MHRFRAGCLAGGNDLLDLQITFRRRWRTDMHRRVGHLDVQRVAVGIGIDRDGRNSHLARRADDPAGDLAAIGDQDALEHGVLARSRRSGLRRTSKKVNQSGVKFIGLSVDPIDRHAGWAEDIKETQGYAPNYPMIGDTDFNVSKLYGMLPAAVSGDPAKRTPADNQTVRNVFVIGPDKKIKLVFVYPMTTGRNFDEVLRVIDSLQLTAKHKVATPVTWQHADHVILARSLSDAHPHDTHPDR